jgi:AraC-like DNA-binding protein
MAIAPPLPAQLLEDQLGALLSLACPSQALHRAPASASLVNRVRSVLRERLAEPGLTATDVAAGMGCSVRSLHRAMGSAGTTFAQALMAERMATARQMLANPALRQVSAAEIGRRVGLLDPSHFGRACRRLLGHTPSALRDQR